MTALLYIHGFNSSPESHKALLTKNWLVNTGLQLDFICPFLSPFPDKAMAQLESLMQAHTPKGLVGSSMGGFYATWLAEKYSCRAVLVNPAVHPWLGRDYLLVEQANYHTGEVHLIEQRHLDQLQGYEVENLSAPESFMVLVQEGDELLDYRMAVAKYAACRLIVEPGGDHGFQGFERYLPVIVDFLATAP